MSGQPAGVLTELGDTDKTVADPAEDVRGRTVRDGSGEELGRIDDLLVDEEGRVRLLRVEHGGILGFGAQVSFVPVEIVTRITEEEVHVDQTRERIAGAPRYDPDLADRTDYYGELYGYYGYSPFWVPGYPPVSWTTSRDLP